MPEFTSLPTEVLDRVLRHLARLDRSRLHSTSKQFRDLVQAHASSELCNTFENSNRDPTDDSDETNDVEVLQHHTQLEEEQEEKEARDVIKLERWDRRELQSTTVALRKERDGLVDEWCTNFVERRISHVKNSNRQLAIQLGPKVKTLFVAASKGTFRLRQGLLKKSGTFRGSIRDVFLREPPSTLKAIGFVQLLDAVVALFLHLAPPSVVRAFARLNTGSAGSMIDMSVLISGLQPARPARLDGVYLRFISEDTARKYGLRNNYGPYVGISNDIGKRQSGHDKYIPVNRLVGKAVDKVPASEWEALILWQCGPTNLSELPRPIASLIESVLIACIGTTVHPHPVQVNLFDASSYNPARYKRYSEASIQDACELIWDHLYDTVQSRPSKRLILPARNSDCYRTWTSQVGHIVCLYPGLTVRRAIAILFERQERDSTSSIDRIQTIKNLDEYKQSKPIPASLFAISQFEDMVRRKDNSGERLTVFRNNAQNPVPASSLSTIRSALAAAVGKIDAYLDERDPIPQSFKRPEKRDSDGNWK